MKPKSPLQIKIIERLDDLRLQTAKPDALIQLAIAGLLTGLITGLVIIGFVYSIDATLSYFLPDGNAENFENLPAIVRLALPIIGSLLLALIFSQLSKEDRVVGIVYVLERLRYHEGYLKVRGFILQFIGAAIALISGQSMGREGPAVHLGASVGSFLGQLVGLPNNTIRTLVACGAAAAIGAAFNTPLAGVIFAMEIIIVEYTVSNLIPIIISAVAATGVARWALGTESIFANLNIIPLPISDVPVLILFGVVIGLLSTFFTASIKYVTKACEHMSLTMRFLLAGNCAGLVAMFIPQVMGLGYDTILLSIQGEYAFSLLAAILLAKVLVTAVAVGCGLPAGLISPSLVMGATAGALLGSIFHQSTLTSGVDTGLFALIGMSAMMAACLQAPVAALTAVFEITANPTVIWPSMLVIVISQLVSRQLFQQIPVFDLLLKLRGLDLKEHPFSQTLRRTGVARIMNRDVLSLPSIIEAGVARKKLSNNPEWILLEDENQTIALLRGIDLLNYLEGKDEQVAINLLEIPGKRLEVSNIDVRATLDKARQIFQSENCEALCVVHWNRYARKRVYGIVARGQFEKLYLG